MIRQIHYVIPVLVGLLVVGGCEQTSAPVRRDILGTWTGEDFPGVVVEMTLAETARAVEGAGAWTDDSGAFAFRVFGALARDEVSLYFDFSDREDISFQGIFPEDDRIEGVLHGAGFRGVEVALIRKEFDR
jgi:hypothetical protein